MLASTSALRSPFPCNLCGSFVGSIHWKAKEAGNLQLGCMQTPGWRFGIAVTTALFAWSVTQVCCTGFAPKILCMLMYTCTHIHSLVSEGQQLLAKLGQNHNHQDVMPSCTYNCPCWPRRSHICRYTPLLCLSLVVQVLAMVQHWALRPIQANLAVLATLR